jgi:hypothetical protein
LVNRITSLIAGRSAIEIGSGSGILADALGINGTDNFLQTDPVIASIYANIGQPIINYGPNVVRLDARAALAHYQPKVVIASWVTHLWREESPELGGNMYGVDEEAVIDAVETYIFIGNQHVHQHKPALKRTHTLILDATVFSRANNTSKDFIAVWTKA